MIVPDRLAVGAFAKEKRLIRTVIILAAVLAPLTAMATERKLPAPCSQKFLATWLWNRDEAMKNLPKKACLMYGETGQYVCDKKGCVRP